MTPEQPVTNRPRALAPDYEFIVVGSGAGGGPVAANLAEAGHRVLLMEAGGAEDRFNYQVPAFHPAASEDETMAWEVFVRHYTDEAQQRRDSKYTPERGGVLYPRAATLGGCTAHNAMILMYPNNSDWDEIARITGDPAWSAARMHRYFERVERCRYRPVQALLRRLLGRSPSRHGFAGWLPVGKADPLMILDDRAMLRVIVRGARTALFASENPFAQFWHSLRGALDPNDWRLVEGQRAGLRLTPLTVSQGHRVGTRERIAAVARAYPERLHVLTGALATRVLLDRDNRATGVEYLDGGHRYAADPRHRERGAGAPRTLIATREVILAGGAFNTPQLLQLSGIGPAGLLGRHGIPVRVDLPGVGANLQDRYEVGVVNRMRAPFALLEGATMQAPGPGEEPDPQFRLWQQGCGPYATNGAVVCITRKSELAEATDAAPDLCLFGLATRFRGYYPGYSREVSAARQYFTWAVLKGRTQNRAGSVAIRSADPTEPPAIDFRYFDELGNGPGTLNANEDGGATSADLEALVDAVILARRMSAAAGRVIAEETVPGPGVQTREDIRRFVRDEAWGHHASCTCRIGGPDDPEAVLDSQFRVRGTHGLRVVDASVFPRVPGLFIVAAVYMIAEKASDDILAAAAGTVQSDIAIDRGLP